MNEWKELEIDNLPRDILTGDYEFQGLNVKQEWVLYTDRNRTGFRIISNMEAGFKYRYRKRQPKAPTHEEIMTKWWKLDGSSWQRIQQYENGKYYPNTGKLTYLYGDQFTKIESATIPPE